MMKSHLFLFFFCFSGLFLCASAENKNDAELSRSDKKAVLRRLGAPSRLRRELEARREKRARAGGSESFSGSARRRHNRMLKKISDLLAGARPGARSKNNKQPLVTPVTQARPKAAAKVDAGRVKRRVAPTSASLTNYLTVREAEPYFVRAPKFSRDQFSTTNQAAQASAHRKANKFLENKISGQSSSNTPSVELLKIQIRSLQGRVDRLQRAGASALKGADRRFARLGQKNRHLSTRVESLEKSFAALRECVTQRDQQAARDNALLLQKVYGAEKLIEELFNERDRLLAKLDELRQEAGSFETFMLDQFSNVRGDCLAHNESLSAELAHAAAGKSLLLNMLAAEQQKAAAFHAGLNLRLGSIVDTLKAASEAGKK